MDFPHLKDNLADVRERIERARIGSGISDPVTIVAVTKGHPVQAIHAAARAGLADIGENRIQEALEKRETASDEPVRWHLIGHLQSNKARKVPGAFGIVHSVDSLKLARALDAEMGKQRPGQTLEILLQVNLAGETQKSGVSKPEADEVAHAIGELDNLSLRGLMTMAPFTEDESVVRRVFEDARVLRENLSKDLDLPELSMGMSGDFELAVKEGATMVRLGTRLFGGRP